MITLYHGVSLLAALLVAPLLALWSFWTGKKRRGLRQMFGFVPAGPRASGPTLWLHALSVGEVNAAAPVLRALRELDPRLRLVVTVGTDAGYDRARARLDAEVIAYHPLDCWPFVRLALQRIRPSLFVLTDTGFWPGLIDQLRQRRVPILLFNGRLSRRSYERYWRFLVLMREVFGAFDLLCMQNAQGVEYARALGAPPDRCRLMPDTKYDEIEPVPEEEREQLRESLGLKPSDRLLVAGSTHPGEEEILLDAFDRLRERFPRTRLLLAPRRLERLGEISERLVDRGLPFILRSHSQKERAPVILLDRMGELATLYALADVAFVGRSLIPPGGGHSLIEPAVQGAPVLHGPYVENQQAQADLLDPAGVAFVVHSAAEIAQCAGNLMADSERRGRIAAQARILIDSKRGASREMARIILSYLPGGSPEKTGSPPP